MRKPKKDVIPVYTANGKMYSECDHFNKELNGRTFPFKCGGNGRAGESGEQHNFAMSIILQNVYNAWLYINKEYSANHNYSEFMINLSNELFYSTL